MATTQAQASQGRKPTQPPAPAVPASIVSGVSFALTLATSAVAALPAIAAILAFRTALELAVLLMVLRVVERWPEPPLEGIGAAQREVIRMNTVRRAAFIVASSQRSLSEVRALMRQGVSQKEALARTGQAEARFFKQHVEASAGRLQAANKIDAMAAQYGDVLGWYAMGDSRTTAECRYASGKNFSALYPPKIGWPGVVHVNCRCYPGPPFQRGRMLS